MSNEALQAIRAELFAAYVEIESIETHLRARVAEFTLPPEKDRVELCEIIRTYFRMTDADFAGLKDRLDIIGRAMEEISLGKDPDRLGYAPGSAAPLASDPAVNRFAGEKPCIL